MKTGLKQLGKIVSYPERAVKLYSRRCSPIFIFVKQLEWHFIEPGPLEKKNEFQLSTE